MGGMEGTEPDKCGKEEKKKGKRKNLPQMWKEDPFCGSRKGTVSSSQFANAAITIKKRKKARYRLMDGKQVLTSKKHIEGFIGSLQ